MFKYRISQLAETDLKDIGSYTLQNWGEDQAVRYLNDLENICQKIADNPELGRRCDNIRFGLRRLEYHKHVIFYWVKAEGIFISRFLHQRMLPNSRVQGR